MARAHSRYVSIACRNRRMLRVFIVVDKCNCYDEQAEIEWVPVPDQNSALAGQKHDSFGSIESGEAV